MLKSKNSCILCKEVILEKTKPEHILLNALGGRMTVRGIVCSRCNHEIGIGPDKDLAESVAFIRNVCGMKSGDGGTPPQIRGVVSGDQKFDLKPGLPVQMRAQRPLEVSIGEEAIDIRINTNSIKDAQRLAGAAAVKIAKQLGHQIPAIIEALKQDILKDIKFTFAPSPMLSQQPTLGAGRSQQSMAKACLVLWANKLGNSEINTKRYVAIRHFVQVGEKTGDPEEISRIDTRELQGLPDQYGANPNIVWVGSDSTGKVFGYFRLYGALGWRFLLCEKGAPASRCSCLISNPFNNKEWELFEDAASPLNCDWVWANWRSWPPDMNQVQSTFLHLEKFAKQKAQDVWLRALFWEAATNAGLKEGDILTVEHVTAISKYVGKAVASYLLKKEIPAD